VYRDFIPFITTKYHPISCGDSVIFLGQFKVSDEPEQAAEPIAAASRFASVIIEYAHPKVCDGIGLEQDHSIAANAKFSMAKLWN